MCWQSVDEGSGESKLVHLNTEIENVDLLSETNTRLALPSLPDWGRVQYREQDPESGGQSFVNDFLWGEVTDRAHFGGVLVGPNCDTLELGWWPPKWLLVIVCDSEESYSWRVTEAQSPIRIWPSLVGSSRQCMILERSRAFETMRSRRSENQFYRHKCIISWCYFERQDSVKKIIMAFSLARLV